MLKKEENKRKKRKTWLEEKSAPIDNRKKEMKLWKKASGALKDRNSIWVSSLSRRTAYRNPDLEAAIIKATSHDESRVDYKNTKRVFAWIRTSPSYLKPLVWSLSARMKKTHSWVVVLKGLMLMHGVFCCNVPAVQKIGRLPFDLSNFHDGHSDSAKIFGYNAFIRSYFAFLDQRSAFLSMNSQEQRNQGTQTEERMVEQLVKLQQWQALLDLLLEVKPIGEGMTVALILEAMDCVIIEIFDVYSKICNGIASVLMRIYGAGKIEAAMALDVLQKATTQGEKLSLYFEFCGDIGVLTASEFPRVEKIPEEDIRELERIINGVSAKSNYLDDVIIPAHEDKASVEVKKSGGIDEEKDSEKRVLRTIITEKWEVFDEDLKGIDGGIDVGKTTTVTEDHFADSLKVAPHEHAYSQAIPDLITFL
ncbi:hypothetical protein L1049_006205 [Liquidambar formosana]|uniref:ENTH domain-containing protein n=1 Tax=Liquidambar formosana TaxID=63359 RepID=A0AAP0WR57_LIQFO